MGNKMNKPIPEAPKTVAVELNKVVQDVMFAMRETYPDTSSYKTIMMNLKNVSKELHSIRIDEIYVETIREAKTRQDD